ncbi:MAG: hypothetical protein U1F08_06870 [Steroidobacteraceae bacterium]
MNDLIKAVAVLVYVGAAIGAAGWLPPAIALPLGKVALVLLLLHALEVPVALPHIRRYPGPLVDSIALTLLFGFVHWLPLKRGED